MKKKAPFPFHEKDKASIGILPFFVVSLGDPHWYAPGLKLPLSKLNIETVSAGGVKPGVEARDHAFDTAPPSCGKVSARTTGKR